MPDAPPVPLPAATLRLLCRALIALVMASLLGGCMTRPPSPPATPLPPALEEPSEPAQRLPATRPTPSATPPSLTPDPAPPARIADGRTLFERWSAAFTPPVCVRGESNRAWRRRYAGHPAGFERQLREAMPLMAYVVEAVEARGLPGEFALIPIVESGYRPDARGPGGPVGLWQMIGSTARNHGLRIERGYDGRLSPVDSTDAALDYLALLHAEFGDWRATAMAYNAGEGRLRRALLRDGASRISGERRLPSGLSNVTYGYVAKLHALACLLTEPGRHGLTLPMDAFTPLEVRVAPGGATRLESVAHGWGLPLETLVRWNPAYRQGLGDSGAPRRLLVPADASSADVPTSEPGPGDAAAGNVSQTTTAARDYTVRAGDTLWTIARRHATSVRALAALNGLDVNQPLRIGRSLRIPD